MKIYLLVDASRRCEAIRPPRPRVHLQRGRKRILRLYWAPDIAAQAWVAAHQPRGVNLRVEAGQTRRRHTRHAADRHLRRCRVRHHLGLDPRSAQIDAGEVDKSSGLIVEWGRAVASAVLIVNPVRKVSENDRLTNWNLDQEWIAIIYSSIVLTFSTKRSNYNYKEIQLNIL